MSTRYAILMAGLAAVVAVLFVASLLIGPAAIGLGDSLAALFRGEGEMVTLVMREVRLPRAILGVLVGAAFVWALPGAALLGALISVGLILLLAGSRGTTLTIILAGIGISALAGALTSLVLNLSPNPFAASEIMFWMMGSLADRSMVHVGIAAPLIVLGGLITLSRARALDALTLGEDAAASMGVNIRALRLWLILGTAALVGAATAVAGAIGFVGLVVPHLLRRAVGARPARLLPASALGGGAVVLAADIAVRLIAPDRDLKLGVLTAIVGAPFFLHLILRTRRDAA